MKYLSFSVFYFIFDISIPNLVPILPGSRPGASDGSFDPMSLRRFDMWKMLIYIV